MNAFPKQTQKMKRKLTHLIFIVALLSQHAITAQFVQRATFPTNADYTSQYAEWVDADNDGALDVLIFAIDTDGSWFLEWYRNENLDFVAQPVVATQLTDASFLIADYDHDNRLDIIASGKDYGTDKTKVFINNGDFSFISSDLLPARGETIALADLDADGRRELILSSSAPPAINIYQMQEDAWQLLSDSIRVFAKSIATYDFNLDTYVDMLVSGESEDGSPVQLILANRKGFSFVEGTPLSAIRNASLAMADFDRDGNPDFLVAGEDAGGQPKSLLYHGSGTLNPAVRDTTLSDNVITHLFAADLTSDGLVDVNVVSTLAADTENRVLVRGGDETILPSDDWIHQRFGDADADGDLDLVEVLDGAFTYFENTTAQVNEGPVGPSKVVAALLYDRLFIYWVDGVDDYTPPAALTYDLVLSGPGEEIISGNFDLGSARRLNVAHGNNGFENFVLLRNMEEGGYNFLIQAVDNALHAVAGGVCHGAATPCELDRQDIFACSDEEVTLQAPAQALWFSFNNGFLGRSASLSYTLAASDTLFSLIPESTDACSDLTLYTIQRADTTSRVDEMVRVACPGTSLHFEAEDNWTQVTWASSTSGYISNAKSIDVAVTANDTITATLVNAGGCTVVRKTAVILSRPDSLTSETTFQIVKGQSVQLQAEVTGGVTYLWQPATGLSGDDISNPVATPANSTEYTVTISDTVGCSYKARFTILVENTAFVPTLFTPNRDGKNDYLKVYGLSDVSDISFRIYNREGNLVFRADNPVVAANQGWDGTVNGVLQPPGVYHWKVEGRYANGDRLLLNGKETGSFVLIR